MIKGKGFYVTYTPSAEECKIALESYIDHLVTDEETRKCIKEELILLIKTFQVEGGDAAMKHVQRVLVEVSSR